jgi:hypothetical protein
LAPRGVSERGQVQENQLKQQIQSSTPAEQAPNTNRPARCIGWVTDDSQILVRCPEVFTPTSAHMKYHSPDCQQWTGNRRSLGYCLGQVYVEGRHTKRHPPKLCQEGWAIRNGKIAECTEPFTRGRTDKRYHSSFCFHQTRRWRKIGYHLGDSVRRKCAYRNCKKGADGNRGTFDQIHRSLKSGNYFCDPRCNAAEKRAREAERVAAQLADAEVKVAKAARVLADNWKPPDWDSPRKKKYRPPATILRDNRTFANKQVAERLDDLGIKSHWGATWKAAADESNGNNRAFVVFMFRVRKWCRIPGQEGGPTRMSIHN